MKNKQRKTGGAFRHAKRLESLAAKKGKDRSKANRVIKRKDKKGTK